MPTDNNPKPKPQDAEFVARATNGRLFTFDALREQIEAQFETETAGRMDIFEAADTAEARRALLLESVNYVLSVESIYPTREEKQRLIDATYANIFGFGPLEPYLDDDSLTEITINGPDDINIRRGFGALERLPAGFDDAAHLRRTIDRLLMMHGAQLSEGNFFLEVGISLHNRPMRLGIITPPVTPQMQVEVRLHPPTPFTLEDLIARAMLGTETAQAITEHLAAGRGLLIVGHGGSGKTTLLGALVDKLPGTVTLVQCAGELSPAKEIVVKTAAPPGYSTGECVEEALGRATPDCLAWDELRDDDARAAWHALNAAPQCVWLFRGDPAPQRIISALSMVMRRVPEVAGIEQAEINRLFAEHLPMVVSLAVDAGTARARVTQVYELALDDGGALELQPRIG